MAPGDKECEGTRNLRELKSPQVNMANELTEPLRNFTQFSAEYLGQPEAGGRQTVAFLFLSLSSLSRSWL